MLEVPKAPVSDWSLGMVDIPKLRYSQIYDYLVAISADGAEMGALKSLKAVKFFKEGYSPGIKISNHGVPPHYVHVSSQTQASVKHILYTVEI